MPCRLLTLLNFLHDLFKDLTFIKFLAHGKLFDVFIVFVNQVSKGSMNKEAVFRGHGIGIERFRQLPVF